MTLMGCFAVGGACVVWLEGEPARRLAEREKRWGTSIQVGDVVFQDLDCGVRCELIRQVTRSRYAHVGIVLEENGERVVWEAFHPVGPTPIAEWVGRGREKRVGVYRFEGRWRERLPELAQQVRSMRGRPYDGNYQWDDERIYCSELIAKAFHNAFGQVLVEPHPSEPGSFGANAGLIRQMSNGTLTEATLMVSPKDLTRAPALKRIVDELE